MIRSTRAVIKRTTIDYSEFSDSDSVVMTDIRMSKTKKKALFLKNLDHQVEATKKKVKREQAAYISSITGMYNTLIGKIPRALQNTPIDQFIANNGKIEEHPEAENVKILGRPSEIVDLQTLPIKRHIKGKTPAKPEQSNNDVVFTNEFLKSKKKSTSKLKKKKDNLASSTKSGKKQTPCLPKESALATPIESGPPKRVLRSTSKNSSLSTVKSTKSKTLSVQKSTTPFLCGTAPVAKRSNLSKNSSMAVASCKQRPTSSKKRSPSQRVASSKSRKIAALPLRQQNQSAFANTPQSSFGSDENAAPRINSITLLTTAHSDRPCRPGEKVFRLADSACPLTESQPAIICPLENGNALTISCDTDFRSLILPEGVMNNLRSFQKKLCAFLRIPALPDN